MPSERRKARKTIRRAFLAALFVAGMLPAPLANSASAPRSWLQRTEQSERLLAAIDEHRQKLPAEYRENLRYVHSDGTVRVMVALTQRTPSIEAFVRGVTRDLNWYGNAPRFYASIDQGGFADLLGRRSVSFVEPDYPLSYLLSTSVPDVRARGANGLWNFTDGDADVGELSAAFPGLGVDALTGKGVTVAVVDSGIDKTHRDFGGWDCTPGPYQPCESRIKRSVAISQLDPSGADPGDAMPTTEVASGHGTHVAGIVAGNGYYARDGEAAPALYDGDGYVIGMAPQASLVSVKVGDGPSAALGTYALQWTLNNAEELDIRVSNNSWGCLNGCSYNPESVLAQLQRDLYEEGVVTVFAAGNAGGTGGGAEFSGNSQSPYVLSVASYDDLTGKLSSFSSRGSSSTTLADPETWTPEGETNVARRPDIAAPGDWIDSAASLTGGSSSKIPRVNPADVDREPGFLAYIFMSGTSMASPHVAGAAALLIGACPAARPIDVMRAVMRGAATSKIKKTDGSGVAEPFEVGYGGLDVRASLEWLLPRPPCNGTVIGAIRGKVTSARSGDAISEARVRCAGLTEVSTDASGVYLVEEVPAGTYPCTVSAAGFKSATKEALVEHDTSTDVSFRLRALKSR